MSWAGDLLTAVRRVVLIEDRVARLDASVAALTTRLSDTRDHVIRLEGLIEGALRTRRREADEAQPWLPNGR